MVCYKMRKLSKITVLMLLPFWGGCTILGFLLSPSASEQQVPAQFPLGQYKEKTLYLVVRGTQASGVDVDVPALLAKAVAKELRQKVKIGEDRIVNESDVNPHASFEYFSWSQVEENARQAGTDFLLYIEIIGYELTPLYNRDYYMGKLITRSVLMDTKTGEVLWPADKTGRIVRTGVEFDKNGRDDILWQLVTTSSHCIAREFYNCPVKTYDISNETKSLDELMQDLN